MRDSAVTRGAPGSVGKPGRVRRGRSNRASEHRCASAVLLSTPGPGNGAGRRARRARPATRMGLRAVDGRAFNCHQAGHRATGPLGRVIRLTGRDPCRLASRRAPPESHGWARRHARREASRRIVTPPPRKVSGGGAAPPRRIKRQAVAGRGSAQSVALEKGWAGPTPGDLRTGRTGQAGPGSGSSCLLLFR